LIKFQPETLAQHGEEVEMNIYCFLAHNWTDHIIIRNVNYTLFWTSFADNRTVILTNLIYSGYVAHFEAPLTDVGQAYSKLANRGGRIVTGERTAFVVVVVVVVAVVVVVVVVVCL
jgi:hypothetical protein